MTHDELKVLEARTQRARALKERLIKAENVLKMLQGGEGVTEQYEDVALQLTGAKSAWPAIHGFRLRTRQHEMDLDVCEEMPREVAVHMRNVVRAWVRHLRAEYEAC